MAIIVDLTVVNNAATAGDWTTSGFDSPQLNNSSSTFPLYLEGAAAMEWPLKKGITGGYTYEASAVSLTGRLLVGWVTYPYADIAAIPITSLHLRASSSTGFTTNYGEWDAKAQILSPKNTPISGHTPVMVYPTNPDNSNGTPNYSSLQTFGWVATTGNNADGKQGGFDWLAIIGWVGAHSATYNGTYLSSIATDATPATLPGTTSRPLGVFTRAGAGDQYRTNVPLRIGDGSSDTANIDITETGKAIYFDNVQPEQELGWITVNPGIYEARLKLVACSCSWNSQPTTAEIFPGSQHLDRLQIEGGTFKLGGKGNFPAWISDALTYSKGATYDQCQLLDVGDFLFEDNTVNNAQSVGVEYVSSGDGSRAKRTSYSNNPTALKISTVGNYTLDGDQFSGNTYDIENADNASTITAGSFVVGRAYKILTVGSTDFTLIGAADNVIGTKFVATGIGAGTGTATEVLLIASLNGSNPSGAKINNSGTNADTLIQNQKTHTVTGLDAGSWVVWITRPGEVFLGEMAEVSGVASYSYNYSTDTNAWVQILDLNKENKLIEIVLGAENQTLPASQENDPVYNNP